ncbi:MAG TPA: efflux RND transporter periplasmic adaptor subunit [Bradyrhizobium sp.]|nr:efflux RND transporter periplasmic adaptor subunit [Bradyrhizobium sp.]
MRSRFEITGRRRSLLFVIFAACVGAAGCEKAAPAGAGAAKAAPPQAKSVAVVEAALASWPETIRVQGSLLAFDEATVGSKLAGRVDTVEVDLGSIVKAGDRLITLVRSELDLRAQLAEAQLRQACATIGITPTDDETRFNVAAAPGVMMEQAMVTEAHNNVNRAKPLLTSRAVSESEYEAFVARLSAAQARYQSALNLVGEQVSIIGVRRKELALAQQMVKDSEVVAPFAGVVGSRRVSPGEYVQAGQAVVTLVRADRLRFTAGVPESRAAAVRVGQRVEIELGGREAPRLVTAITRVSPTVMQSSRSILIEADVPNATLTLQAGLFAEAELVVDPNARAVSVPASAVSRFAGVQKVWIIVDGVAKQLAVRTGRERNGQVEIVEGLSAGSLLVQHAEEGHDGPVIATQAAPDTTLRAAERPTSNSAADKTPTAGAAQ